MALPLLKAHLHARYLTRILSQSVQLTAKRLLFSSTFSSIHPSCTCSRILFGYQIGYCSRYQTGYRKILSYYTTKPTRPYEINSNVPKNVLIYSNENKTFLKFVPYFGIGQFVFWGYLALFVYQNFKEDKSPSKIEVPADSWISVINAFQMHYKNALSVLFFSIGYIILNVSVLYPTRTVRQLWLIKGGKRVGIATYGFAKKYKSFIIPVEHINCIRARHESGVQIPMKIKGKWFYFLLDKNGVFHNSKLFDYSVGLKRQFKI
ncbi:hypothetical protein SNE40_010015 [Patella caerulea]|uniref:Transmembrane protein 223 n=1 Tax=Patella caerulea TaxID=87958 RepID=A0AAN8JSH4_PATCE